MKLLSLALLVLSGASIIVTLSETPAFDPDARRETVLGDWRVAANTAMYDKGAYAFQRGYGFLAADALVSGDTEARDELADPALAEQRALMAIEALKTSVRLDPGNAYAWASLGWGYARIADNKLAIDALRKSWKLAPNNRVLADTRIALIGVLTTPDIEPVILSDIDTLAIQRDFEALHRFDKGAFRFHAETLPHLQPFASADILTM